MACQHVRTHLAKDRTRTLHLGHHAFRNAQCRQQLCVPLVGVDIKEHGAGRIAHIGGVHRAATELPHQPTVHRAKQQLTALGLGSGVGHVVQQPLQLGARKIRVDQQTGFGLNGIRQTSFAQGHAGGLSTSVLPNDGVINGLARCLVPHHTGFALVGDAQRGHLMRANACLGQRLLCRGQLGLPNLHRIMFDPPWLWVDLSDLLLCHGHDLAAGVEHNAARTGGALVKSEDVGHGQVKVGSMCDVKLNLRFGQ